MSILVSSRGRGERQQGNDTATARARLAVAALAGIVGTSLVGATVNAQVLYEPFDYGAAAVGTAYANTSAGFGYVNPMNNAQWASASSLLGNDDRILNDGTITQYAGLAPTVGNLAGTDSRNLATKQPRLGLFPGGYSAPGTTVYYSMLLRLTNLGTIDSTPNIIGGFHNGVGTQTGPGAAVATRLTVRQDPTNLSAYNIGLATQAATTTWQTDATSSSGFKQYSTTDQVFVVGGYTINGNLTGTDDVQSLWINPSAGDFGSATVPTPTISLTGGDLTGNITSLLLRTQNTATPSGIRYDEIRADLTWAGVTPGAGSVHTGATSNDWSNAGTWDAGGVPNSAGAFAYLNQAAGGTVNVDTNQSVGTLTLRSASPYTVAGTGGTLNISGGTKLSMINVQGTAAGATVNTTAHAISAPVSIANDVTVHSGAGTTLTMSGGIAGTGNILKDGPGTLVINNNANFAGGITATYGTLVLKGTNSFTGPVQFLGSGNSGGQVSVLEIDGDAALGAVPATPTNSLILSKSAAGSTGLLVKFDSATTLHANRTVVIGQTAGGSGPTLDTNGFDVTVNGNITGSSAGVSLVKAGAGTLFLRGDNSTNLGGQYVGALVINAGTVNADRDVALGRTLAGSTANGSIQLAGGTLQFANSFVLDTRTFAFSGTGGSVDTNGFDNEIPGVVSGAGAMTKIGAGTLTLSGANTHTGSEIVSGGVLLATKPAALNGRLTAGKVIGNAGGTVAVRVGGTGEWLSTNVDTLRANATWNAGSFLGFDTTNATGGSFTYSSAMAGAHGISKLGAGTLVLDAANTYGGSTTVNAGTLVLGNADATAGSAIDVKDGALARAQAGLTKAVTVSTLATNASGKFDLTNNSMVVKGMDVAQVEALVKTGYNLGGWNGTTGIVSSTAEGSTITALGVANAGVLQKTSFKGVATPLGTETLVKYTYYGDSDLSGFTTLDDFTLFLGGYQSAGTTWFQGDYNYSGAVTLDDFNLFLAGYQQQGAPLSGIEALINGAPLSASERAAMLAAVAAVPEPTGIAVLGLAAAGMLARRRRRI